MKNALLVTFIISSFIAPSITYAQSPREQLTQMVEQLKGNASDNALRERIIKLAQEIKPPPAMPEEAERRIVRGTAAFKGAKSTSDYQDAAREFEQAALAAPWYADAYYNLATARSKAEDYAGAVWSLRFYLLAAPDAKDAKEARALMYEMEYKQERVAKQRDAERAEQERQTAEIAARQRAIAAQTIVGFWRTEGSRRVGASSWKDELHGTDPNDHIPKIGGWVVRITPIIGGGYEMTDWSLVDREVTHRVVQGGDQSFTWVTTAHDRCTGCPQPPTRYCKVTDVREMICRNDSNWEERLLHYTQCERIGQLWGRYWINRCE